MLKTKPHVGIKGVEHHQTHALRAVSAPPEALYFFKTPLSNGVYVLRMHVEIVSLKYSEPKLMVFLCASRLSGPETAHK
jgi:hypothetical protein